MKPVALRWSDGEWAPTTKYGMIYVAGVINNKSLLRNERVTVAYDNGQICTFRRKSPAPINQQPEEKGA